MFSASRSPMRWPLKNPFPAMVWWSKSQISLTPANSQFYSSNSCFSALAGGWVLSTFLAAMTCRSRLFSSSWLAQRYPVLETQNFRKSKALSFLRRLFDSCLLGILALSLGWCFQVSWTSIWLTAVFWSAWETALYWLGKSQSSPPFAFIP